MNKLILTFICGCALVVPAWATDDPPGPAVDKHGNTAADPTKNVEAIVLAEARRQDDLRLAEARFNSAQTANIKEMVAQEREHQKELNVKEAGRLDSIRQVDRDDVSKTAAAANIAITTLAKQTADLSTTLAKQVQDTAIATEARQTAFSTEVYKRLQSLELSSSERTGKQQVYDPQAERYNALLEKLSLAQSTGTGKSEGMSATLYGLIAIGGLMIAFLGLQYSQNRKNADWQRKNGAPK